MEQQKIKLHYIISTIEAEFAACSINNNARSNLAKKIFTKFGTCKKF